MSLVTVRQRLYLGAVAGLALWVGVWCFFVPGRSATAIPWSVMPLCAAFLGAMYLSGMVFCGVSMLARRWHEVRVIMPLIALWTGGLALISLFFLPAFDFTRPQVWIWFGAYIAYPLIALGLLWTHRAERGAHPAGERAIPAWAKRYLRWQAALMGALGLALLVVPAAMQTVWPWATGKMLLQLYAAPLLTYALGSLSFTRQQTWSEIRIGVAAMGVFTGLGLLGSLAHADLLNGPAVAVALWLVWLAATTAALGLLSWVAYRPAANAAPLTTEGARSMSTSTRAAVKPPTLAARAPLLYAWVSGGFLLLQGTSTLLFRLVPALDTAFPPLLAVTQMIPVHSLVHILTGVLALATIRWGGPRGVWWFAVIFGLFYTALGVVGLATNAQLGLGLQPFDNPFHLLAGVPGLVAAAVAYRSVFR